VQAEEKISMALADTEAAEQPLFPPAASQILALPKASSAPMGGPRMGGRRRLAQAPGPTANRQRCRPGVYAMSGHWHSLVLLIFAIV